MVEYRPHLPVLEFMLDLAIVVLSYNVCDLLRKCLTSTFASQGDFSYEVCVVDNASKDDSVAMVQEEFSQAKLVVNERNLGYPAGNNVGLKHFGDWTRSVSPARYALLLNPDTELPPTALADMWLLWICARMLA